MFRSRRTFLSVLVLLSLNEGLVLSQISPGTITTTTENGPNFKSTLTLQTSNPKPDFLSTAQRLLGGSQRPILNDFSAQQNYLSKPPLITIESSYQQNPVNVNPTSNLPIPFTQATYTGFPVFFSPENLPVETVDTTQSITVSSVTPPTPEYSSAFNENDVTLDPTSFNQIPQTLAFSENFYDDNIVQQPELPQFYQSPVTVQATSTPAITQFTNYANAVPSTLSQNLFMGAEDLVPTVYTESINSPNIPFFSQTETVPGDSVCNVADSGLGYTMPLSLQINMPSPTSEQPIIFLSSPSPAPDHYDTSYTSPMLPMVPPLIVKGRSRSKWRNILPILLIALCDSGCCQNSGNCGCSGCNIPVPYPIPMPTNNPIILSRGNKKRKTVSHSDDDC